MKSLFAANVVSQFFILNGFLGTEYQFWGIEIMLDLYNGREWSESGHFPRVTLCDFAVRRLGNLQRFSVQVLPMQCVLMMNMFNEKIFLFLWFWFLFVASVTFINLLYWIMSVTIPGQRKMVIQRFLRVGNGLDEQGGSDKQVDRFISDWLKPDGVLLLRFIGAHNGDLISMELTRYIWEDFVAKSKSQQLDKTPAAVKFVQEHDDGFAEDIYDPPTKNKVDDDGHSQPLLSFVNTNNNNGAKDSMITLSNSKLPNI